VAQNSRSALG